MPTHATPHTYDFSPIKASYGDGRHALYCRAWLIFEFLSSYADVFDISTIARSANRLTYFHAAV